MPRAGASKIRCVRHSVSKKLKKLEMMNKQEQILVRITGQDRPGLTASIMGILAKYDAQILDIGQADIHSTLSLGILIRMDETNSGQVMKELLFKATELNVNIGFSPITDDGWDIRVRTAISSWYWGASWRPVRSRVPRVSWPIRV